MRLPDGYRLLCSSTKRQARAELLAGYGYITGPMLRELLERRQREGEELARKRKAREGRWAGIASGDIDPFTVEDAVALHSEISGPYVQHPRHVRGPRAQRQEGLQDEARDRLLRAVTAKDAAEAA